MRRAISSIAVGGALLAILAQFLPLFHTHVPATSASVGSGSVGADHAYSVLLLALLALFLAASVFVSGNRFALMLIGLLGIVTVAIALGHDLSDARGHGIKLVNGHYESASNIVGAGLYVELVGGLVLLAATAFGLLFGAGELVAVRPPSRGARSGPTAEKTRGRGPKRTPEGRRRDSSDRPRTGL